MAEIPLDSGLVDNASAKKSQYIASRALLYYGQWLAGLGSEYQQYLQIGPLGPKPIIIKQALPRRSFRPPTPSSLAAQQFLVSMFSY
jgi:hypothetical protein